MSWPVQEYSVVRNNQPVITIAVFETEKDRAFSAVIMRKSYSDEDLKAAFEGNAVLLQTGTSIPDAVESCKSWIRAHLWQDIEVIQN